MQVVAFLLSVLIHVLLIVLLIFQLPIPKTEPPKVISATVVNIDVDNIASISHTLPKSETSSLDDVSSLVEQDTVLADQGVKEARPEHSTQVNQEKIKDKRELPFEEKYKDYLPPEPKKSAAALRAEKIREEREKKREKEKREKALELEKMRKQAAAQEILTKRLEQERQEKKEAAEKARAEREKARKKREAEAAEERKKAEKEQRRKEEEAALASQIAEETQAISSQYQRLVGMYSRVIKQKIEKHWNKPIATDNLEALLVIRLSRSGELLDVRMSRGSGNAVFDRSIINAVRAAARFPEIRELPDEVFEDYFEEFEMSFKT